MLFEYIKSVIYGILEGITEWLPISSTGHLILLEELLPFSLSSLYGEEFATEYRSMFDVVIQFGAILAVVCLYWGRLCPITKDSTKRKAVCSLWGRLILATIPAALIAVLADILCEHLLGTDLDTLLFRPQIVASALIVYGIMFILTEKLINRRESSAMQAIGVRTSLAIGFFQALALVPGTSRSGATILGARVLGLSREAAAEFSFLAALPIIGGASLIKTAEFAKYISSSGSPLTLSAMMMLLIAGGVAFAVSMLTIKFLTDFVKKHSFVPFGIYRIILGITVLIFFR